MTTLKPSISKPSVKASSAIKKFKSSPLSLKAVKTAKNLTSKSINLGKFTKIKTPKTPKMVVLKKAVKNVGF